MRVNYNCAHCRYWQEKEENLDYGENSSDFPVKLGWCSMREAYTDEFYVSEQFEAREEKAD